MAGPYPSYIDAKTGGGFIPFGTDATRAVRPEDKPFNLNLAPAPAIPNLPQLNVNIAGQGGAARPRAPGAIPDNGLPRGVPANAIPVIRGGADGAVLSYDIPGTGQRLYPTLEGGVSEFSPEQRLELARFTEPAQIQADASVRGAGIRAGADITSQRLAQEGARFRTLAELGATPRPAGAELVTDPATGLGVSLPTYGVPKINPQTGAVEGFQSIGAAAQRSAGQSAAPREGATGTYQGQKVVYRNGKWVASGN